MLNRKDGKYLRDVDSMHTIMPIIYPNRCDNEAFISEIVDLTNINRYLEKKNGENPEYKYNLFQVLITSLLKTLSLRPKMNRFVAHKRLYQRNEISAAFTVKKIFSDDGEEALAFIHAKEDDNINSIHDEIYRQVSYYKGGSKDSSTEAMDFVQKLPVPIVQLIGNVARFLDKRGLMPKSVIETDPYYATCVVSNLGSIKLHAGYHHLTNWGTTSVFMVIGERKLRPFYDEEGKVEMRDSVDITLTVDERIADGYYYAKTIRLLRKLLENPELLETALIEKVEY
ncbi:MAG: 2-oxo acid dehydrogenase subunit E2 [Clostridia bacterium]|nr:2-oxo acid dehydrogenase subunit E2 [Clostridia bacterium]